MRAYALLAITIIASAAWAQETILFTDRDKLVPGPAILVKPEILVYSTPASETTHFTVNLSNPGTASFTQVSVQTNETFIQRATGLLSLKTGEAKTFNLSVNTNSTGIFISKVVFTGLDAKATLTLVVLSYTKENAPTILFNKTEINTLENIEAIITAPEEGTLYYGLINMDGELMGVVNKEVSSGEEVSVSINVPKEATPGKYAFFASINQESYAAEIIEITTFLSIQLLIIAGLMIVGLAALIQGLRMRKKEVTLEELA
jgi:hypothetical protein